MIEAPSAAAFLKSVAGDGRRRGAGFSAWTPWAVVAALISPMAAAQAQSLPTDPQAGCTVSAATFATWFQSGAPALNGVVNPANSVAFPGTPNCSFYQWSKQMFLWLTSPSPSVYGAGAHIFESPVFFDVLPADGTGKRPLVRHSAGRINIIGIRGAKPGPHGLPIAFDSAGRMVEIQTHPVLVNGPIRVMNTLGRLVAVSHAEFDQQHKLVLRGATGAVIERAAPPALLKSDLLAPGAAMHAIPTVPLRPLPSLNQLPNAAASVPQTMSAEAAPLRIVSRFILNNIPIFIDGSGNVVDVDQGQADGSVLMAQNGSLVYYALMVNDVYAYFKTGQADNLIEPGNANPTFPTSLGDLNAITTFAAAHGETFPDPDALTIEVKSSWVVAAGLPNIASYITTTATIPTYDKSAGTTWTQNGMQTVQLALVGIHIVGSTAAHPEMIWATFEHFGNTPNADYQYINSAGHLTDVPQSTVGSWLFAASGAAPPFNQKHIQELSPTSIGAVGPPSPNTISASNTIRWKPFGAASNVSPNPIDGSPAASNSEIIAINNSVGAQLPSGDVRNNYYMVGATWTIPGQPPGPSLKGTPVGTSDLSDSTLETYDQGSATTAGGDTNCFSCHVSSSTSVFTTGVSNIYSDVKPLF